MLRACRPYTAQVLATAIGEGFRLPLCPGEAQPGGSGETVDEQNGEGSKPRQLGVLHHFVVVCLGIGDGRRQCRVEPTEDAGEVAAFVPCPRTHARDRKISHRDIAGFDIDEERGGKHLRAQGTQKRCLADTGRADDQDLRAALFGEPFVGADDFHGASLIPPGADAARANESANLRMSAMLARRALRLEGRRLRTCSLAVAQRQFPGS